MTSLKTLIEWAAILVAFTITGFFIWTVVLGGAIPASEPSGLPDGTGGFYQTPLSLRQQYTKSAGDWSFTLIPVYSYTLAGRVVGRHPYPATLPDAIIPLDLAVVNGDLIRKDILSFFTFEMGDHTLKYSYDIPTALGLTEEYIDEHISNNHLVFLNTTLENEVKNVQEGSCIIIRGRLIDIRGTSPKKSYVLNTSTVRNDEFPAGCEVILVDSYMQVSCGTSAG